MTEFVRPIYEHIKDLFILDIEALCDFADNLEYHIPDSLCESKFHATHGSILKESAYGLIVGESLGRREDVVLHGRDGSHCNLRGEVAHLVLSQSKESLALLKDDFQGPAPGVNPVGLEEVQLAVGGDKSVPLSPLAPLTEEQADITSGKCDIDGDVVASQTATILAPFFRVVEEGDELVGGVLPTFIYVLCLAHLDHAKIMASDVAGGNELDNVSAGKPAVCKDVVKVNLALDNTAYHLNHQVYLALVVFLDALGGMRILRMLLCEAFVKLLLLQAIVTFLAFLAYKSKVKQYLADTVGDADEQTLEAEHHRMRYVRVYFSDKLCLDASFGIVGVVHHQADGLSSLCRPFLLSLAPKLAGEGCQNLAPVIGVVRQKTIECVALTAELAA